MIKLIAIDLDDTLLNKEKEISLANVNAISKARLKGIKVVIASGRPFFRISPILEALGLKTANDYVIAFNGGRVTNGLNSVVFYEKTINNQSLKSIYDVLRKYDLCFNVYQDSFIYTSKLEDSITELPVYKGINFIHLSEEGMNNLAYAHKVIFADSKEKIEKYKDLIIHRLGNDFSIVRTTPNFLEILPKGTSKGEMLKKICGMMNINKENVMAIGDEENDLSMFNEASISVAMENATNSIKERATFITKSCEESGVAYAILNFISEDNKNE